MSFAHLAYEARQAEKDAWELVTEEPGLLFFGRTFAALESS